VALRASSAVQATQKTAANPATKTRSMLGAFKQAVSPVVVLPSASAKAE
jgi:hypothetical protein